MRSSRRGSVSMTSAAPGSTRVATGSRAATTIRTRRARSTDSRAICSACASKRETSMRSSTSDRSLPTSATRSSPARRLSAGSASRCSRRIDASATSAANGVRSSWLTSATNRRFRVSAASSLPIVSARASAIRLKRSAQVPNSSSEVTGTRADRSPCSSRSAAWLAASTGASTPRAMTRATSRARRIRATVPTVRASRNWASAFSMAVTSWTKWKAVPEPLGRPPTIRLGLSEIVVQVYASSPRSTRSRKSSGRVGRTPARSSLETTGAPLPLSMIVSTPRWRKV